MAPAKKIVIEQLSSERLTRIEDKLDKLSDAIVSLARAEEKLINLEHNITSVLGQITDLTRRAKDTDDRIGRAELALERCEITNRNLKRFFWIVVTGLSGILITAWYKVMMTIVLMNNQPGIVDALIPK